MFDPKVFDAEWGIFALAEFLVSSKKYIGKKYFSCLDIGSGNGVQSQIMKASGLDVQSLDKYSEMADYQVDFCNHDFKRAFDIVYCSHVIEHQRNVGFFLDKIFDILSDDGVLIIIAPKHGAETIIEGHLNCFFSSYFIQHLIHAGFDLKNGKYLSCGPIENAAIVSKARNFKLQERLEDGYKWTTEHQERSFLQLKNKQMENEQTCFFNNCEFLASQDGKSIRFQFPKNYVPFGFKIRLQRFGFELDI